MPTAPASAWKTFVSDPYQRPVRSAARTWKARSLGMKAVSATSPLVSRPTGAARFGREHGEDRFGDDVVVVPVAVEPVAVCRQYRGQASGARRGGHGGRRRGGCWGRSGSGDGGRDGEHAGQGRDDGDEVTLLHGLSSLRERRPGVPSAPTSEDVPCRDAPAANFLLAAGACRVRGAR